MNTATAVAAEPPSLLTESYSIEGLLDNEDKIKRSVLRYLEKHNIKRVPFGDFDKDIPLFDVNKDFPPSSKKTSSSKFYFDGDTVVEIWASHNNNNRGITVSAIKNYAVKILSGGWRDFLPQGGLVFDWNQQGINDQHRLGALYIASLIDPSVKLGFEVGFNADPADIKYYDVNRPKTEADLLTVDAKLTNTFNVLKGVDQKRLLALVKHIPSISSTTRDNRLDYIKSNISSLKECLEVLSNIATLNYDKRWAGVFADAIIGPDGVGFTNPDKENMALRALRRFCRNEWAVYDDVNLNDPLHLLFKKLVENMNAKKSDRLGKTEVQEMTTYLLRKALMVVPVKGNVGARTKPKITKFGREEYEDFRLHGASSQVLKTNSVARRSVRRARA